ncbi:MAG: DUF86 domain-containing protein [Deltaproteobacteria bacterium]|nr:DUF86 domain-containing protein [Nannocystaceae bacterium]
MTDVGLILHKLQRLREQVELTRKRRPEAVERLAADLVLRDAMSLALLVAVQAAVDIAYHLASDEGWGVPDSHASAFELLAMHGVVDDAHALSLSGVARVRNRIAHGYASIDHARMWAELPAGLDALDAFAVAVASWLPPTDEV